MLVAVGYYCHFSLSYRDISEILKERGIFVHPTTIMRWVHEYGNLIYQMWKNKKKNAQLSWKLDETYIKVKGKWCYLYRAIDKEGYTLDVQLRKKRVRYMLGFQSFQTASTTLADIEAMHMIKKAQTPQGARSVQKQIQLINTFFGITA
ncbi:IS6 family transposase [Bacillus cereus]|nr:IS6 family transposase [Bacillus cereus]MBJ8037949.1 IS6 family transposase [Bacillus cereus]